ncbi:MAG: glycoside hydrolase family 43 protein [Firmicutes bacterium]|nr:glycoside hydrolase family 43 protein [Bacillota bacterium]
MKTWTLEDIQIRDPFVVPVPEEGAYYLFGSTDANIWGAGTGFDCYRSEDLAHWTGPIPAFRPDPAFWARENFWAPEVYRLDHRWIMLATFKHAETQRRGTAVLASAEITGPYRPLQRGFLTPDSWNALDGTFYQDEEGQRWLVFCREWVDVQNGEIWAEKLTESWDPDPRQAPVRLFTAREAPWVVSHPNRVFPDGQSYVTDGPFVHRLADGSLYLLWSSFTDKGYALGGARSPSGRIEGPWIQEARPIYDEDGGHGMVFRGLDGQLRLALHRPNRTPHERARFFLVEEEAGRLRIRRAGEA